MNEPGLAPTPTAGKRGKRLDRRRLMIYGGVAAGLLLLALLARRRSAPDPAPTAGNSYPDVQIPAGSATIPTSVGGGDGGGYVAGGDNAQTSALLYQLPDLIAGSVTAGIAASGLGAGSPAQTGQSGVDVAGTAGLIAALSPFLLPSGNSTGAQTGGAKTATKTAPHPATTKPPAKKPAAPAKKPAAPTSHKQTPQPTTTPKKKAKR